jgi:hypothetical protein
MSTEFEREDRYIVFRLSDLGNSLKGDEVRSLAKEYAEQRKLRGKPLLECVVVESDWPEYEPTWRAIEARVTGAEENEMKVQKLHYENISGLLIRREGALSWRCPLCKTEGQSSEVMRCCPECGSEEAAIPGAHPAPSFADAYQGAMEDVAIWKKRALEAEDLNRKFVAAINGSAYMGEPAQPAPSIPEGWKPIPEKHPTFDLVDLRLADGSVLCGCVPQSDGDYWWEGPSGEVFIDPKYAPATHWRLAAAPEAKP